MSFFEDKQEQEENKQELEKIKIGETEFDPQEAQQLIELGKLAKEAETKFNTKIDRLMPEYSKKANEAKQYQDELQQLKAEAQRKAEEAAQDPELTPEVREKARQQAKALGIMTSDVFEEMFTKKFDEYFNQRYSTNVEAQRLVDETSKLAKEIDGSDGRPKFNQEEVLQYMQENGVRNPMSAYKLMYEEQLDQWREQKLGKTNKGSFTTQVNNGGVKEYNEPRPKTQAEVTKMLTEMLYHE